MFNGKSDRQKNPVQNLWDFSDKKKKKKKKKKQKKKNLNKSNSFSAFCKSKRKSQLEVMSVCITEHKAFPTSGANVSIDCI